jgi:hypothetical protein
MIKMLRSHHAYACKFVEYEWIRVEVLCLWSLDIRLVLVHVFFFGCVYMDFG